VPEAETIADSSGDGDGILQRAPQFNANYVAVGIDAKSRIAEFLLYGSQERAILRGDGDCRGIAARDFLCERRSAKRSDCRSCSIVAPQHLCNHFGHPLQRAFLQALGCADD
jgi:hypothetical protein